MVWMSAHRLAKSLQSELELKPYDTLLEQSREEDMMPRAAPQPRKICELLCLGQVLLCILSSTGHDVTVKPSFINWFHPFLPH